MGETLGGYGDINGFAAKDHAVFDVDIVGPLQAANGFSLLNFAFEVEHKQTAVLVLIRAYDQALGRIGRVDPNSRIIRIMADSVADVNRLDDRFDSVGFGGLNGCTMVGLASCK